MTLNLHSFNDANLDTDYLTWLIDRQAPARREHYRRLWEYFRNRQTLAAGPLKRVENTSSRPYMQAQEQGLPGRITGVDLSGSPLGGIERKEIVIENDIAWRIDTMVDFLFGRPVGVRSRAADSDVAAAVDTVLQAMWDANGGAGFFQELALFGSVYGFVDVALRTPADGTGEAVSALPAGVGHSATGAQSSVAGRRPGTPEIPASRRAALGEQAMARAVAAARRIALEAIEAPRVLPVASEDDCRRLRYWVQTYRKRCTRMAGGAKRWLRLPWTRDAGHSPEEVEVIEILAPHWWQRYENRRLASEGPNPLGAIPVVHIQNLAMPAGYPGVSDVEPLIPLQDELNTRLSDRANRVTYQAFKMYLGKGIEDFLDRPIGPGQMWATSNTEATIEEFGADADSPSEESHIEQVRRAMDKVSGVTPLAAGLIQGNVGHLTSATALKVLLAGVLSRTQRKRLTYGAGIARIAELALTWLDAIGVFRTSPAERRVEVHWPSPLPGDEHRQLQMAREKLDLGVPADRVLAELGYADSE
jgi:hypothetical protein